MAITFLVLRGRVERLAKQPILFGTVFGLLATYEVVFTGSLFPYSPLNLACSLATVFGGWEAGLIAGLITFVAELLGGIEHNLLVIAIQICISVVVPILVQERPKLRYASVAASQSVCVFVAHLMGSQSAVLRSPWTIIANVFAVMMFGLVARDAETRSRAEELRREAIELRRVAAEAQLSVLRSRVHPHFLYNALTSVAALCDISPKRAAKAAITLGGLMRKSLESSFTEGHSLAEELETVKSYVAIESERFGPKLKVTYEVNGLETITVPNFSVQVLVENAIVHGVSQKQTGGTVCVIARKSPRHVCIAVADDGIGITPEKSTRNPHHGVSILDEQLRTMTKPGKLKIINRPSAGTLSVIRLPYKERN